MVEPRRRKRFRRVERLEDAAVVGVGVVVVVVEIVVLGVVVGSGSVGAGVVSGAGASISAEFWEFKSEDI